MEEIKSKLLFLKQELAIFSKILYKVRQKKKKPKTHYF